MSTTSCVASQRFLQLPKDTIQIARSTRLTSAIQKQRPEGSRDPHIWTRQIPPHRPLTSLQLILPFCASLFSKHR
ncbi:hypothetical protein I307_03440 [Cryptococcus deuterogattii 99/473]|uniref:Uncharacterized protein n=1 Tax=Cryptococcus deuterogattii Ram5 TaxID=1296110 RepID=A0A0D0U5J1_9TREE|nr:hypothetical protein I309_00468 [Cryptococcus deuterogattii LA55]KIR43478.1 hypothetical protein I313_00320 [Cryptococcus deuterogattii Ram5]KIR74811.1 hypothetical protein I310_01085 [Cryptococcus deuterogattii CA1014]KIR92262.1 hypothetical protein I304_03666 [Cryptococcus deuterogattii CBS 10090]KIS01428.1 hypothetical protein L804_01306 [Cryptococcus deuterogattii 2001/935-1]KIY57106.1 hypothetical protein I307_03440 [Cryptococcus deuterogattii 99/473]